MIFPQISLLPSYKHITTYSKMLIRTGTRSVILFCHTMRAKICYHSNQKGTESLNSYLNSGEMRYFKGTEYFFKKSKVVLPRQCENFSPFKLFKMTFFQCLLWNFNRLCHALQKSLMSVKRNQRSLSSSPHTCSEAQHKQKMVSRNTILPSSHNKYRSYKWETVLSCGKRRSRHS